MTWWIVGYFAFACFWLGATHYANRHIEPIEPVANWALVVMAIIWPVSILAACGHVFAKKLKRASEKAS